MENRKPMDLKSIIIGYNIFQIASCSFIVFIVRFQEIFIKLQVNG